jgi:hypothetical protein
MGSPCCVKISGLSALLGKVENAPTASAANPNLTIVFICIIFFYERVLAPSEGKTPTASKTLKKKSVAGIALRIFEGLEDRECGTCDG